MQRMLDMAEDQPFLMPVVIDATSEILARVPDRFRERPWTRLPGGAAPADFVERVTGLLTGVRATASMTPASGLGFATASTSTSGTPRAEEGFWVAVLPFKYSGSNEDLTALAEALSEEIVTGLSRFSYLRVIALSSTLRYATGGADVRTIGREIGARYVMEGGSSETAFPQAKPFRICSRCDPALPASHASLLRGGGIGNR